MYVVLREEISEVILREKGFINESPIVSSFGHMSILNLA
jgi:hypothetical protein